LTVWLVFVAALGTALATGMGAVPLLLRRTRTHGWLAIGDAIAAGMMTAATIALLYEGARATALFASASASSSGSPRWPSRHVSPSGIGRRSSDRSAGQTRSLRSRSSVR